MQLSNGMQHQDTLIDIASILTHLVPHGQLDELFTDQVALYCAGLEWDNITDTYQFPDSWMEKTMKAKKKSLGELGIMQILL